MKRLSVLFGLLLALAGSRVVWADGMNQVVSATTVNPQWTVTVFNDNGSAIPSYAVVAWDDDDTDFSTSMYPYIISATTADDPYTAGVMITPSCPDQALCEIQVYGPSNVLLADATDNSTVDQLIGASTVSGQAGDYATGADTCALGTLIEATTGSGSDHGLGRVFINISCD